MSLTNQALEEFLSRSPLQVGPELLGARLSRQSEDGLVTVRLTEVEAYCGQQDPGSHAFRGPTPRTEPMFGPPGRLYVYFSYGMHWCTNLVAHEPGVAGALLLRAGEVVEGHELVLARRRKEVWNEKIASGPANLAQALGLDGASTGLDLASAGMHLELPRHAEEYLASGRVGVSGAGGDPVAYPWRYYLPHRSVSTYRPGKNVPNLNR